MINLRVQVQATADMSDGQVRHQGDDRCDQPCKHGPNGSGLRGPRFPNDPFFHCGIISGRLQPDLAFELHHRLHRSRLRC